MSIGPLDLSGANTAGFEAVDAGRYNAAVAEMSWDAVKNTSGQGKTPAGTPMLKVRFKLISDLNGETDGGFSRLQADDDGRGLGMLAHVGEGLTDDTIDRLADQRRRIGEAWRDDQSGRDAGPCRIAKSDGYAYVALLETPGTKQTGDQSQHDMPRTAENGAGLPQVIGHFEESRKSGPARQG